MPAKSYGFKNCLNCENKIIHKNKRDIERKKFCSKKCLGSYTVKNKLPKDHMQKLWTKCNTPEANAKKVHKGEAHPRWIKDRSKIKSRCRYECNEWRKEVFERDNYVCQHCNKRGGKLQADHIKPYSLFPTLRFDVNNGRTLCTDCHKKTDTYGSKFMWKVKKGLISAESF